MDKGVWMDVSLQGRERGVTMYWYHTSLGPKGLLQCIYHHLPQISFHLVGRK